MSAPAPAEAAPTDPATQLSTGLDAFLPDIGLGTLLGLATGYAVKMIGRAALLAVGLLFIGVQLLVYAGVITVDWLKLQALTEPLLRQGREGFGDWFSRVFLANLPFGGSFVAGFFLGLRLR